MNPLDFVLKKITNLQEFNYLKEGLLSTKFYLFIYISWRLITLQYCSGFCHTLT